jgi:hypothetical protein
MINVFLAYFSYILLIKAVKYTDFYYKIYGFLKYTDFQSSKIYKFPKKLISHMVTTNDRIIKHFVISHKNSSFIRILIYIS